MRGLTAAWLFGMGIITWRAIARQHQPPVPGTMLAASGFFALLALVSEYQPAAPAAAATGGAWTSPRFSISSRTARCSGTRALSSR